MKPSSKEKRTSMTLIAMARKFRGQVISMVDNLGGILSEGTLAQKRAYYEQIAHQCAQIINTMKATPAKINDCTAYPRCQLRKASLLSRSASAHLSACLVHMVSIRRCHLLLCRGPCVFDNAIEAAG